MLGRVGLLRDPEILRLQLCSLHPAALCLALRLGQPSRTWSLVWPQLPPRRPPGSGLTGRASVVQALAVGRGQFISVTVRAAFAVLGRPLQVAEEARIARGQRIKRILERRTHAHAQQLLV